ncbi:MAG: hypothetical protein V7637_1107 [Mycobacteriales bacterium]
MAANEAVVAHPDPRRNPQPGGAGQGLLMRLVLAGAVIGAVLLVGSGVVELTGAADPAVPSLPGLPSIPRLPSGLPSLPQLPTGIPGLPTDLPTGLPPGFPTDLPTGLPPGLPSLPSLPGGPP